MRQRGFGLLEMVIAIGVLSTLFMTGIFLARESLSVRKLQETRESLDLLARSFYAYGSIPTDEAQFVQFLNTILKTDLDPFSRQYRLILANSVDDNKVSSVCKAESTDLTVRTPDGRVLANVVVVLLSAGEDGTYDTFTQNGLPNQSVVRVETTDVQGPLALQLTDVYSVVTLPEFKVKNCALPSSSEESTTGSTSHYARLFVGNSRPTWAGEGDLFYHLENKTLEKYTNGTWVGIDWQAIVKESLEYKWDWLRISNGQLQVRAGSGGGRWYNVIPAVGAKVIEIMDVDNQNYSLIYWIPPGTTAIIKYANHLPIAYTTGPLSAFKVEYMSYGNIQSCGNWIEVGQRCEHWGYYGYYIGLRPSGAELRNGLSRPIEYSIPGQAYSMDVRLHGRNLSIVPVALEDGRGASYGSFTIWVARPYFYTTGISKSDHLTTVNFPGWRPSGVFAGSGPIGNTYWLGTWWTDYYEEERVIYHADGRIERQHHVKGVRRPTQMYYVAITRLF